MSNKKNRTIRISERTRDTLWSLRMVNETYDDVIKRLIYELAERDQVIAALTANLKACEEALER